MAELAVTPHEKLEAIREWVDKGIEATLKEDPSGFLLGVESVSVLTALDEISDALTEALAVSSGEGEPTNAAEYEVYRSPATFDEAMTRALDWAEGRRSYTNMGPFEPYTPDVIAVMDAQEVVKWTAIASALAGSALSEETTKFAWLIERGQSEGQAPTVWLDTEPTRPGWYGGWTTDANEARKFASKAGAEAFMRDWHIPTARVTEHGFAGSPCPRR